MSQVPRTEIAKQVDAFLSAVRSVGEHNRQFSGGQAIADAVNQSVERLDKAVDLVEQGFPQDEAESAASFLHERQPDWSDRQEVAVSLFKLETEMLLEPLGIEASVAAAGGGNWELGDYQLAAMRLQVADGASFISFLDDVRDAGLASDEFVGSVSSLAQDHYQELVKAIQHSDGDEIFAIDGLVYAGGLGAALQRLGTNRDELVSQFQGLATAAKGGYAREYLDAREIGILDSGSHKRFTPDLWHRDSTSTLLQKEWDRVINVIDSAARNPRAQRFASHVLRRAATVAQSSITDLRDELATTTDIDVFERKVSLMPVLQDVSARLQQMQRSGPAKGTPEPPVV